MPPTLKIKALKKKKGKEEKIRPKIILIVLHALTVNPNEPSKNNLYRPSLSKSSTITITSGSDSTLLVKRRKRNEPKTQKKKPCNWSLLRLYFLNRMRRGFPHGLKA